MNISLKIAFYVLYVLSLALVVLENVKMNQISEEGGLINFVAMIIVCICSLTIMLIYVGINSFMKFSPKTRLFCFYCYPLVVVAIYLLFIHRV